MAAELYETALSFAQIRRQAGLASDVDVLTAQNRLLTARSALAKVRQMTIAQGEDKMTAKMQELYDTVLQKQSALRTAELTLQKGQREKQNADLKYSAGLLDREAYLKEEQTWLERTASLDAARLALAEAMDDYDWAVLGFVSLR